MISIKDTLIVKDSTLFNDIEKEAIKQLNILNSNQRVRDEIFRIIKELPSTHLIKFPIKDNEITAFILNKNEKIFVFINSNIPLDKQIYGAAHELYHVLNNPLKDDLFQEIDQNSYIDIEDSKANSFAACFLAPRDQLMDQIKRFKISIENISIRDIIKLMDIFLIPYKAMVIRLFEINLLDARTADAFLTIADQNSELGVIPMIEKTRYAIKSQKPTYESEFSNLIELGINAYQNGLVSDAELKKDFKTINLNEDIDLDIEYENILK